MSVVVKKNMPVARILKPVAHVEIDKNIVACRVSKPGIKIAVRKAAISIRIQFSIQVSVSLTQIEAALENLTPYVTLEAAQTALGTGKLFKGAPMSDSLSENAIYLT